MVEVADALAFEIAVQPLAGAEGFRSDAVVGCPVDAQVAAQKLLAKRDDELISRERVVYKAEMTLPVCGDVVLQLIDYGAGIAIAQPLAGHLVGGAKGTGIRTAAHQRDRPVTRAGQAVRPAVVAVLALLIFTQLIT